MKLLTLIAFLPLISLVQPAAAAAASSVVELQRLCNEQERQIHALELENKRLRSQIEGPSTVQAAPVIATKTPPNATALAAKASPPAPPTEPYHTVKSGDTLSRIARKNGTTTSELVKLNQLKDAGLIRLGQRIKLPAKPQATATQPSAPVSKTKSLHGTHTVKPGETFFGIARIYGLSVESLTKANPRVDPDTLEVGQTISLQLHKVSSSPAPSKLEAQSAPPIPKPSSSVPISKGGKVHSVLIDEKISFATFAEQHDMEPAKINALNGLNLEPKNILAVGSTLYVSAQP